jgi:hypothetical protein
VRALASVMRNDGPPGLASAMRYAVFPGGGRIRPRLSLAVNAACGGDMGELAAGAAAAIELLHCASLVHDDLPCFNNAGIRRGRPSVHRAFGESMALLTGDALIVLAFQTLAHSGVAAPVRLGPMMSWRAPQACPSALPLGRPGSSNGRVISNTISAPRPAACSLQRRLGLQCHCRSRNGCGVG